MSKKCTPLWREAHLDVEKVHAVVARSTFPSQNAQKTPCAEHFWKFRCRKSARRCGAKPRCQVKSVKNCGAWSAFGRSDVALRGRRTGFCTLPTMSKTWAFCGSFKRAGTRGTFEEDLQRCILCGRRSTRDMFIRDVRRSGH